MSFFSSGSSPTDDDERLMMHARRGSREAFSELVRRHERALWVFFRSLGAAPHDAEDGVQETFLRVWARRSAYRPAASFRAYLCSIARNLWIDILRRRRGPGAAAAIQDDADGDMNLSVPADVSRAGDRIDVAEALAELPERMRVVLVLSVYQGLSYPEIAAVLDLPVGTVKTRVFYALRRLRNLLESHVRDI